MPKSGGNDKKKLALQQEDFSEMKDIEIRKNQQSGRDQARSANANKHRKKRKRKHRFYYTLLIFFLFIVGVILSVTVFFNIDTIQIEGNMRYTEEDIATAGKLSIGQNLLRLNTTKIEEEIIAQLEYCDKVTIKRSLPGTILITISEASPYFSIEQKGKYLYVSEHGRVLNINEDEPADQSIIITGLEVGDYQKGQFLQETENEKHQAVFNIRPLLEEYEFKNIRSIDLSNLSDIVINYDERVNIKIGTVADLEYKIRVAQHILAEQLSSVQTGDLQYVQSTGNYHFIPKHNLNSEDEDNDAIQENNEGTSST